MSGANIPVDPKCRAMDSLRSCYYTKMRFPGFGVHDVVWYFTDGPLLGMETIYHSHNWEREEGDEDADKGDPGEVWGTPRYYSNGARPGHVVCGEPFGDQGAFNGDTNSSSPTTHVGPVSVGAAFTTGFELGYDS